MRRELLGVLVACAVAGCAAPRTTEVAPAGVMPAGCAEFKGFRKLKVVYSRDGEPIEVRSNSGRDDLPVADPAQLRVRECEAVQVLLKRGSSSRSGMVAFDKGTGSPGRQPAYLSRRNFVVIPIDDREGTGEDRFAYSVHVDCPEQSACKPLDPMIIVER